MNRLPIIRPLSRQPLFFLRYSSKDASSSGNDSPPADKTTTTPAKIGQKDSAILADHKKEYIQVIEPCEMPRQHRKYAEVVAKENQLRSHMHMRIKKKVGFLSSISWLFQAWASLGTWASVAAAIFIYTMYAVKQETFLEEIDDEMAEIWNAETEKQHRKRKAEEILKERGRLTYYLYKWGFVEV